MTKLYNIIACFFCVFTFSAQGFQYESSKKTIKIPFKLYNNLTVIPLTLNNVKLNFLLDTGVENTILFSLEETDSIDLNNVKKIKILGLGSGEPIDGLHSKGNRLFVNDFKDYSHDLYIILDQNINFSQQMGIPIHGIIGYDFFKNNIIEINYRSKQVIIHNPKKNTDKNLSSFQKIPFQLELSKPYIQTTIELNNLNYKTKMLVDSGGTDAAWLFESGQIKCPELFYEDFLGKGFSGDIFGKRSRVNAITIGNSALINPTVSFPDNESLKHVSMVSGRNGSIGAGILKRFDVVFDYKNHYLYLKKNSNFEDSFNYNMSGIEIIQEGSQLVEERINTNGFETSNKIEVNLSDDMNRGFRYHFVLKPKYQITNVRDNSPAKLAGIEKGDIILKINGVHAYKYELQSINNIFQEEEGKTIKLEIERNGTIIKTSFELKKIL